MALYRTFMLVIPIVFASFLHSCGSIAMVRRLLPYGVVVTSCVVTTRYAWIWYSAYQQVLVKHATLEHTAKRAVDTQQELSNRLAAAAKELAAVQKAHGECAVRYGLLKNQYATEKKRADELNKELQHTLQVISAQTQLLQAYTASRLQSN